MSAQIIPFSLSQLFTLDKHSDQGPNEMIMSFQWKVFSASLINSEKVLDIEAVAAEEDSSCQLLLSWIYVMKTWGLRQACRASLILNYSNISWYV